MNTYDYKDHTIVIKWEHDEDSGEPWKECDGHGPVSEWTRRDKRPGERVLCSDRGSHRFYDYAEAIRIAKRDGWDAKPYKTGTKGEQAARAVDADFEYLRRWCANDWWWCGYIVTIEGTEYRESLWSIDSDSQKEFEAEALKEAQAWLDNELVESSNAACRDIATV